MKITKHAQSCFLIKTDLGSRILIDPGDFVFGKKEHLTGNDFKDIDLLIITHSHSDHFDIDNIGVIIKNSKAIQIFATSEVKEAIYQKTGYEANVISNGISLEGLGLYGDISLTGILSKHGPLPNGNRPPVVSGVLIKEKDGTTFYHPGDTIQLKTDLNTDIVAVPICGAVTLDIEQAKEQLQKMSPKLVIPIHYDNPAFPVDVKDFVKAMVLTNIDTRVLRDGETLETSY
jgi:L-ascorbate metabolism protein UlaG (beta-lactamase superfamily)